MSFTTTLAEENRCGSKERPRTLPPLQDRPRTLVPLQQMTPLSPVLPTSATRHTRLGLRKYAKDQSGNQRTANVSTTACGNRGDDERPQSNATTIPQTFDRKNVLTLGGRTLTKKLGRGAFGDVFLSTNIATGELEAAKIFSKSKCTSDSDANAIMKEYYIGKMLVHPNIAESKQIMQTPERIILFVEYAGSESLCARIKAVGAGLPLDQLCTFQSHLLSAVKYCHSVEVAHLDLKPENAMICRDRDSNPSLKLIDFGCAIQGKSVLSNIVGTMPFIAPEVLVYKSSCPFLADMWSCGVIMLEMISGLGSLNRIMGWEDKVLPEKSYGRQLLREFNCIDVYDPLKWPITTEGLNVLFGLLCPSADMRMTSETASMTMDIALQSFNGEYAIDSATS